ncbi:helix-turn-helix transcriptional regulator [Natrinema soli]|uniref:Helix-turn-helix transcriptional regulator n=1 Tax=Natrinema soli TaxID=1930624 RepID=A0ABD5SJQ4_9EURY|nr:hypothetical protein [Natrinema soli]
MNRSGSVGFVGLVILALVTGVCGPIALADTGSASPSVTEPAPTETRSATMVTQADGSPLVTQETQDFDNTTFEITVHENGSATWTFRYERRFANDDNATAARENFEAFAEEFEANETDLYDGFTNQSRTLTEIGGQATGREMDATNFRRSAQVEEQFTATGATGNESTATGVVEMSFTWTEFGVVEADRIVVGDVFESIPLASNQAIVIEAGGDLTFRSIEPDDGQYAGASLEDAESVRWSGQREFIDGRPRAVFDRPGAASNAAGLLATISSLGLGWYLVGALLCAGIGVAAVVWYRRRGPGSEKVAATASDSTGDSAPPPAAADTNDESDGEPEPLSDEELMTDEDRVVTLIQENGGRMKQVNIVEETGWSKSKVSMLLSDMEDDGTISKLRVGRENIISLEGFEPEATKSPFDE